MSRRGVRVVVENALSATRLGANIRTQPMSVAVLTPRLLVPLAAAGLAVGLGAVVAMRPLLAVVALACAAVAVLPRIAPATHLTLIVAVAALVPLDVQRRLGTPILPIDVLLLSGLAWAALTLMTRSLGRRAAIALSLIALFLLLCLAQFAHGILVGNSAGDVAFDMRNVLGIAVAVVALPLLNDDAERRRVLVGLMIIGLLVGLWGNAQWVFQIGNGLSDELGVSQGVALTSDGVGKVLGGRYAFGTSVVLAFAVLLSPRSRSLGATALLMSILVLNSVALVLAFERAFWLATAFALMLVVLGANAGRRARALLWGAMAMLLVVSAMSALAPGQFSVARERFLSVGQFRTDSSVRYRVRESSFVAREIHSFPFAGSGLGAGVYWGRPAEGVLPSRQTYAHNAYLWLAWKLGIAGLLLGLTVIGYVVYGALAGRRRRPPDSLRDGAVAALLAVLVTGATAPVFSTLGASVVIGILLALALAPTPTADHVSDVRAAH